MLTNIIDEKTHNFAHSARKPLQEEGLRNVRSPWWIIR